SLFQDDHGRIWLSTLDGFGYLENDRFVPIAGLPGGLVNSMVSDKQGNLWLAHYNLGLFCLSPNSQVRQISWADLGQNDLVTRLAADPSQGGLWLGFAKGGIAYFKDGQIRQTFSPAEGLAEGRVYYLRVDPDGTLWAAADGGLSRLKK